MGEAGRVNVYCFAITNENLNETVKPENETVKLENETVKPENETVKPENKTVKPENETVKPENETVKSENETVKLENEGVKKTEKLVYEAIQSNTGIREPGLMQKTGKSRATVARAVALLKQQGKIEYRGAPKTGGYYPVSLD